MVHDKVEFYRKHKRNPFCSVESSHRPKKGDYVNISKVTYVVLDSSFSVDQEPGLPKVLRCNVIVDVV